VRWTPTSAGAFHVPGREDAKLGFMRSHTGALCALLFVAYGLALVPLGLVRREPASMRPLPALAVRVIPRIGVRAKLQARVVAKKMVVKKIVPKYLDPLLAQRLTNNASRDVGIPVGFVRAIMNQESAGDLNAHSSAGALGLMQMLPAVAREWGAAHPYDMYENVYAATRYIAYLRTRYHGDVALTAAAYNAGPGTVDQYHGVPPYPETKRYVAAVVKSLHASLPPAHAAAD
jgi:soluble lytic murein transglycosylase-like protein